MFRNDRVTGIVRFLAEHDLHASPTALRQRFDVSERTLRADVAKANRELAAYGAILKLKRGGDYRLSILPEDLERLESDLAGVVASQLDSAEDRIDYLVVALLYSQDRLSLEDLSGEVYVSVNTMAGYIRTIRETLAGYKLALEAKTNLGYRVVGSELDKRKCLFDLLDRKSSTGIPGYASLESEELEAISEEVERFKQELGIRISDYSLRSINKHIALAISRIRAGFSLIASTKQAERSQLDLFDGLIDRLQARVGTPLPAPERNYIAINFAARSGTAFDTAEDVERASAIVTRILRCIVDSYRIDLTGDRQLFEGMRHHMQSIIASKRLGMSQDNPLLNTIKTRFMLPWEMAETAVAVALAHEPYTLTSDEIGYMALHLGAALERSGGEAAKRVAILTESSVAEGKLLSAVLKNRLGNAISIVAARPINEAGELDGYGIDFAVSTAPVAAQVRFPVIVAQLPLKHEDWLSIDRHVEKEGPDPIATITGYFDESLFCRLRASSKAEVLDALCSRVEQAGIAEETFRSSVLEREERIPTAMNETVALPHPLVICCRQSRVAIGILEEPVRWSPEHNVRIVLMLALSDDQRDITTLYDTLVLVMNDQQLLDRLADAKTLVEFLDLVRTAVEEGRNL